MFCISPPWITPPTWRVIFGFNDENDHPDIGSVKQRYYRRLIDGPFIGTQGALRAMLDKAFADAESELAATKLAVIHVSGVDGHSSHGTTDECHQGLKVREARKNR